MCKPGNASSCPGSPLGVGNSRYLTQYLYPDDLCEGRVPFGLGTLSPARLLPSPATERAGGHPRASGPGEFRAADFGFREAFLNRVGTAGNNSRRGCEPRAIQPDGPIARHRTQGMLPLASEHLCGQMDRSANRSRPSMGDVAPGSAPTVPGAGRTAAGRLPRVFPGRMVPCPELVTMEDIR